jgi:hypothetical protein
MHFCGGKLTLEQFHLDLGSVEKHPSITKCRYAGEK